MTIKRTRELLKYKVSHLTDEELATFIVRMDKALEAMMKLSVVHISKKSLQYEKK